MKITQPDARQPYIPHPLYAQYIEIPEQGTLRNRTNRLAELQPFVQGRNITVIWAGNAMNFPS